MSGLTCGCNIDYEGQRCALHAAAQPASVMIPVTWNDADRASGIDHWIANATYWHDQCQQAWHTRDMVSDLQERIDAALLVWQEHLTATPGEPGQYRCECVGCEMGRALTANASSDGAS